MAPAPSAPKAPATGGTAQYYPPVAFYFEVSVGGTGPVDGAFREVSGLERELEVQEIREGGQNLFTLRLPKRVKHPNLVLKRGVVAKDSGLATWAEQTMTSMLAVPIELRKVMVTLLDRQGRALVAWTFWNAYPVKWVTSTLNATEAAIAVETFELTYAWSERQVYNTTDSASRDGG
ncbi:MAG: phage tail protein [Vicinamibacterales bacterium]